MCNPGGSVTGRTPHNNVTHQRQEIVFPQHENDIRPPAGKQRKRSITKNPKIGGLPLIPIQHEKSAAQAWRNLEVGQGFISFMLILAFVFFGHTVTECTH